MAKKIWVGGSSGNEGNYGTAANWSPSGVPVASDDVVIPSGSQSITDGLDQSAVSLSSFTVSSGYTGSIGSSEGSLQIAASKVVLDCAGTNVYIDADTADMVVANTSSNSDALHILGTITSLTIFKGNITLDPAAAITTLNMLDSGARVTSNATAGIATINLEDGTLYFEDGDITTLNQHGGSFKFNAGDTGHTLATAHVYGGTFDCSDDPNAKTITNLDMWPDATVKLENDASSVVLTNPLTYHGGRITVDEGRTIGIS